MNLDLKKTILKIDPMHRRVYTQCKKLNARIAVVGTKQSATFFLGAIKDTDIPLIGVYEGAKRTDKKVFHDCPVHPIQELSRLNPDDVVVIASSAKATELYDTFMTIKSLCPCKTIHLRTLLNVDSLITELKEPLKFQFDDFLFCRGLHPLEEEGPFWHPNPPLDFTDQTILELGPFEGNNTVMLMEGKPKKVIGLETRPLNYAKISVIRSLYNWQNFELILGDMHLFPQLVREPVDVIFCSGVFYHSDKPWWLLKTCMENSDTIVLCGHVASEHSPPDRETRKVSLESGTYLFEVYPEYGWDDGLSGVTRESLWFKEEDLIHFLDGHGFQFEKYGSAIIEGTGLWIFSVVKKIN